MMVILFYSIMFNVVAGYWLFNKLDMIQSHGHMIRLIFLFFITNILGTVVLLLLYGLILYACLKQQFSIDEFLEFVKEKIKEQK